MKTNLVLAGALCAVSAFAIAMSAYAYRTRDTAIAAWAEWAKAKEREAATAQRATQLQTLVDAHLADEKFNQRFYRTTVLAEAGLPLSQSIDARSANMAVRDYIYRTTVVGNARSDLPRSGKSRYAIMGQENGQQLCGGMTWSLEFALNTLEIPTRYVTLAGKRFLEGKDRYQTHAVAEVFIDGKWQVSDSTYNVSLDCSDGASNLSVEEAFSCLAGGNKLVPIAGKTQIKGRTVQDLGPAYPAYFAAYSRNEIGKFKPADEFPEAGWIGKALSLY